MATRMRVPITTSQQQNQIVSYPGLGSVIQSSRRTRPFWFDGRFLAARDMERDQNYFLARQADLGKAAGFGVIHGLLVVPGADAETIVIQAGQGITPGGHLVTISSDLTIVLSDLADAKNLDEQFGLAETPTALARTRTGLYVLALRPVQFTANPIASYPTSLQGSPTTHDGNIVEASAVSLFPYPDPPNNYDSTTQQAAAARQIFVSGDSGALSNSLLPLAIISIQRGVIEWTDPYLVRRDSGPEFAGLRFGLADPAAQQAFLLQYDGQLQQTVSSLATQNLPPRFPATDYFQALPPAGRLPLASIDVTAFTQLYFPQQTDVWLSLIPADELPAWIEDSLSLPLIDLTLAASAYADLSVFILVPVARAGFAALAANLAPTQLTAAVPPAVAYRNPVSALRFYQGKLATGTSGGTGWTGAIGSSIYGYYVRRRSTPIYVTSANRTTVTTLSSIGSDVAGVTLTATVSPSAATGSITFSDGATVLGTAALAGGVATLTPGPLAAGAHSLKASYCGDSNFSGSVSAPLNLNLTAVPFKPATIALSQLLVPGTSTLAFKAAVSPAIATGSILFQVDSDTQSSTPLSLGSAVFQVTAASLANGTHSLNAEYTGDEAFAPATAQLQFTVGS